MKHSFIKNTAVKLRNVLLLSTLAITTQFSYADSEYAQAWGPDLGTSVPLLAANDTSGVERTFENLKGENGLLLVFNRSVDW